MQKFSPKLWSVAGALAASIMMAPAAVAEEAQAAPAAAPASVFPGDFSRALTLMMAGEGGEGGIGMHRVWPTASVPALDTEQVREAVSGNSLAMPHHYTMQFSADGRVGGYHLQYAPDPRNRCPRREVIGDGYLLHDGVCQTRTPIAWSGTWRAADNRLCLDLTWEGGALNNCYLMFFMLDSVALVQPDGTLLGKGHNLRRGVAADEG